MLFSAGNVFLKPFCPIKHSTGNCQSHFRNSSLYKLRVNVLTRLEPHRTALVFWPTNHLELKSYFVPEEGSAVLNCPVVHTYLPRGMSSHGACLWVGDSRPWVIVPGSGGRFYIMIMCTETTEPPWKGGGKI